MSYTHLAQKLSLPPTYFCIMATATDFTLDEKKELLALLNQLKAGGIKYNLVASATGINYKSFINKVKSLEAEVSGIDSKSRNRFTRTEYEGIKAWWGVYKAQMFAA